MLLRNGGGSVLDVDAQQAAGVGVAAAELHLLRNELREETLVALFHQPVKADMRLMSYERNGGGCREKHAFLLGLVSQNTES
jgi:hypothetical protein